MSSLPRERVDSQPIDFQLLDLPPDVPEGREQLIQGLSLHTLNVTAAVSLGIVVGDACIRQILRSEPGPLGDKRERS